MKKIIKRILVSLICLCVLIPIGSSVVKSDDDVFYLQGSDKEIAAWSFDNSSTLPVSNVRYDKFLCNDGLPSTTTCPKLGVGMKYIVGDNQNIDGGGKWRYVYCLEFAKDAPEKSLNMTYSGWSNRKVAYALYYGAVYYGYPCRYEPYSTGDWEMDYFVTQMAVHILNNEFTLQAFLNGLNQESSATQAEKDLAYDRVTKMVNGANNTANYEGFTGDGWLDLSTGSFSIEGFQDSWSYENGKYYSDGVFQAVFESYYGYDFREQITGYEIETADGVTIQKLGNQTYADFRLEISEEQYKKWQLTGHTIPVTVTLTLPRYWGAGVYECTTSSNFQKICMLTWSSSGGEAVYTDTAELHIDQALQDLTVYKVDAENNKKLQGAVFSLWAFDGISYSQKVGEFADVGDGSYQLSQIDYTATKDGKFLIVEEQAPDGYEKEYVKEEEEEESYNNYGGREICMDENGFYAEILDEPFVFRDYPMVPQGQIIIRKMDCDSGENLADAEFSVYQWNQEQSVYENEPLQVLMYSAENQCYQTKEYVTKTEFNEGKFLIRETKNPEGYTGVWEREIILSDSGIHKLEFEVENYPYRSLTIQKKILVSEVNWAHGNPTFFFRVTGCDTEGIFHVYQTYLEFDGDDVKEQEYYVKEVSIYNIPAGEYQICETEDVLRYVLTDAEALTDNITVEIKSTEAIHDIIKIQPEIQADLTVGDGKVSFTNRKVMYDKLSDNAVVSNYFVIP